MTGDGPDDSVVPEGSGVPDDRGDPGGPDAAGDPDDAGDRRDAPFAALSAEIADRERRRAAADDPFEAFEEVDLPEFDGDPWAALDGDDGDGSLDGDAVRAGGGDHPGRVVNKREYCQQCPHVSAPPALSCTHEGTDIVEVLDDDQLRVCGCPMIDETDARSE